MIQVALVVFVVAVLLWMVLAHIRMSAGAKELLGAVVTIALVLWVLFVFARSHGWL
jgi:hypothetical protein